MNNNLITSLRIAVSALAGVIFFSPVTANAYTSSGTDGQFQPTVSMILDSTGQTFNFTSILIPSGVTVSFSRLASAQQINLLATGNIDIAGTLDAGANNLWIETPGSISLSGSLNASGGDLSLVASTVNLSGIVNTQEGSNITLNSGSGALTGGGSSITSGGSVLAGGAVTLTGGDTTVTFLPTLVMLSPVPEAEAWVMLSIGFCALFAASRRRYQNIRLA